MATDLASTYFDPEPWRSRMQDALAGPGVTFGEIDLDSPHDGVHFAFEVRDDIAEIQADDSRIIGYLIRPIVAMNRRLDEARERLGGPIICKIHDLELITLPSRFAIAIRGELAWVADDGPHAASAEAAGPGQEAQADQSWRDRPSLL